MQASDESHVREAGARLHHAPQQGQHGQALRPHDHGRQAPGTTSILN